jgi:hypothetical protein
MLVGQPLPPMAVAQVQFDQSVIPPGSTWVRAFVETGSSSPIIIATLAECNSGNVVGPMFCGARSYGGNDGILVSIILNSVPAHFVVIVTIAQANAKVFNAPILYTGL